MDKHLCSSATSEDLNGVEDSQLETLKEFPKLADTVLMLKECSEDKLNSRNELLQWQMEDYEMFMPTCFQVLWMKTTKGEANNEAIHQHCDERQLVKKFVDGNCRESA